MPMWAWRVAAPAGLRMQQQLKKPRHQLLGLELLQPRRKLKIMRAHPSRIGSNRISDSYKLNVPYRQQSSCGLA